MDNFFDIEAKTMEKNCQSSYTLAFENAEKIRKKYQKMDV